MHVYSLLSDRKLHIKIVIFPTEPECVCVCVCVPGTIQIQERQKIVEKSRMNELEVPCKRELDVVSKVCLSQTARWALLGIEMLGTWIQTGIKWAFN